ncbi:hypothetical protein DXG01_011247 [Tephrocybe rancida]|nr:hypothetical protein DXG01_011247 [Tephrocybe rancida]
MPATIGSRCRFGKPDKTIDTSSLRVALTRPNKESVVALQYYLVQRCFKEKLSASTADQIQAAFVWYYDHLDHGQYSGDHYEYLPLTNTVRGNPARAIVFKELVASVHNRDKMERSRNHAEAVTIEHQKAMIQHSESILTPEALRKAIKSPPEAKKELYLTMTHARNRSYSTLSFTVWGRHFEMSQLKGKNIQRGFKSEEFGPHTPYSKLKFDDRKGSKTSGQDGPPSKQTINEIDGFTHTENWQDLVESILGRPIGPEEYVFPYISPTGSLCMDQPMSVDNVIKIMNDFAKDAGIKECGGLLPQFVGGEVGLTENREEKSYSDQLNPSRWPARPSSDTSFLGEATCMQQVATRHDLQLLGTQIISVVEKLLHSRHTQSLPHLPGMFTLPPVPVNQSASVKAFAPPFLQPTHPPASVNHSQVFPGSYYYAGTSHPTSTPSRDPRSGEHQNMSYTRSDTFQHPGRSTATGYVHYAPWPPLQLYANVAYPPSQLGSINTSASSEKEDFPSYNSAAKISIDKFGVRTPSSEPSTSSRSIVGSDQATEDSSHGSQMPTPSERSSTPTSRRKISKAVIKLDRMPSKLKGAAVLQHVINHWEAVDKDTGIAQKNWPPEYIQGDLSSNSGLWKRRRTIAEEYYKLGGSETAFFESYPDAGQMNFTDIVLAIEGRNEVVRRVRRSKNGSPEERALKKRRTE